MLKEKLVRVCHRKKGREGCSGRGLAVTCWHCWCLDISSRCLGKGDSHHWLLYLSPAFLLLSPFFAAPLCFVLLSVVCAFVISPHCHLFLSLLPALLLASLRSFQQVTLFLSAWHQRLQFSQLFTAGYSPPLHCDSNAGGVAVWWAGAGKQKGCCWSDSLGCHANSSCSLASRLLGMMQRAANLWHHLWKQAFIPVPTVLPGSLEEHRHKWSYCSQFLLWWHRCSGYGGGSLSLLHRAGAQCAQGTSLCRQAGIGQKAWLVTKFQGLAPKYCVTKKIQLSNWTLCFKWAKLCSNPEPCFQKYPPFLDELF